MQKFENEFTYRRFVESGKEQEFDSLFESAIEEAKKRYIGKKYGIYIGGKEVLSGREYVEKSPIDGSEIATFHLGDRSIAQRAIGEANSAFEEWHKKSYKERANLFLNAANVFSKNKFIIGAVLSMENGKNRYESIGEVDEAIDFMRYYAIELLKNRGYVVRHKLGGSTAKVSAGFQGAPGNEENIKINMVPYGVFGVIAPFNFPISISTGMSTGAMVTGNTVVFKPSSTDNTTMLSGYLIYEFLSEAGIPPGVFNYLPGPGSEVGDELVINKEVKGIVFTGSRKTGMDMIKKAYDLGLQKVFVVEMGGKNPIIVSKTADLDEAAEGIVSAAFGYSGQKCSAGSRVYVHESVKEILTSKIVEKTKGLKIGNPLEKGVYIGPLISEKALQKYKESIEEAKKSGRIIYGGKVLDEKNRYVEPTIVEADHSNRLFKEELFVPILLIDSYKDFEEAIRKANDTEYGLTSGLYSRNRGEIREFEEKIEAGVVYVNRRVSATTGAIVGAHSFVGWKGSGLTGKGTGSRFYLLQFLREKSVAEVR
ncbi:MAG: aldehyde dehydrogenase family protein [Candidatus Micrarchaeaceae archaeon]